MQATFKVLALLDPVRVIGSENGSFEIKSWRKMIMKSPCYILIYMLYVLGDDALIS